MEVSTPTSVSVDYKLRTLEESVRSLRDALQYWRTWEAEYEGFKEEIEKFGENATTTEMQAVANEFGGDILTPKECQEILNTTSKSPRSFSQVISVISRRIDYVQGNAKSLQKRIDSAEAEIASLKEESGVHPARDDVLQFQEITEVLDDEDNVVSSTVTDARASAPEILDALRKSGVKGLPDLGKRGPAPNGHDATKDLPTSSDSEMLHSSTRPPDPSEPEHLHQSMESATAPHTGKEYSTPSASEKPENLSNSTTTNTGNLQEDVREIPYDKFPEDPIIPEDETPEEAAIRREMLQYNMNEMGAIVATMNLEDPTVDMVDEDEVDDDVEMYYDEDYDDMNEEEYSDGDDENEPEDEYGRTTTRVIDEDYRNEMLELERRLKSRVFVNVGPDLPYHLKAKTNQSTDSFSKDIPESNAKDIEKTSSGKDGNNKTKKQKKAVRFADNLDIASEAVAAEDPPSVPTGSLSSERPIAESVVERSGPTDPVIETLLPKERSHRSTSLTNVAQVKQSLPRPQDAGLLQGGPLSGMQGTLLKPLNIENASSDQKIHTDDSASPRPLTHSNVVVERSPEQTSSNVRKPDEFDPDMTREQLALEYQRARERFVRKHGSPNHDEEDDELRDLSGKKMSRFKAARLSKISK